MAETGASARAQPVHLSRATDSVALCGRRVMLVEDDHCIAMELEHIFNLQGCDVIGPLSTLSDALQAAHDELFSIAVLDVNLRGERIYPVIDILVARNIPFVLLTGYGRDAVREHGNSWTVCDKPFRETTLLRIVTNKLLAG